MTAGAAWGPTDYKEAGLAEQSGRWTTEKMKKMATGNDPLL